MTHTKRFHFTPPVMVENRPNIHTSFYTFLRSCDSLRHQMNIHRIPAILQRLYCSLCATKYWKLVKRIYNKLKQFLN